ncbi:hypothetical protein CYLTODRAFT_129969 [Cylindrobasidium torrendii FP15055 ss-10]|uniref:DUF6534 domain-containing protein n=1 Tax=Cylindrobasidium torrendii FP15055 ss-10 TaxID=1314674 RepID=A0A0D7AZB6_9AGAR|nr:hypothetical protein CYLTODRAFT_129969 [Cylindrobasidium torrendii FP15055 ss-10]
MPPFILLTTLRPRTHCVLLHSTYVENMQQSYRCSSPPLHLLPLDISTMGFLESNIHNTMGLLFQATVIGSALYGVGCSQGWSYYRNYWHRDSWPIRTAVTLVLLCDTIQMALLSESLYLYVITHHGDSAYLARLEKTLIVELFFSGIVGLITQSFYAYRIWAVSKKWYLVAFVAALITTAFVLLTVYFVIVIKFEYISDLGQRKTTILSVTVNGFTAACDISITIIMVAFLERSKTGFRKSNAMINRLIFFVFNTGIPTTICAILSVALVQGEPQTYLYIFFYLLMGRFYTCSLLITLNARDGIREIGCGNHLGDNSFCLQSIPTHLGCTTQDPQGISINIETSHTHTREDDHTDITSYETKTSAMV